MAYLTVNEYVTRYGERETILFTNEVAAGPGIAPTYDPDKVEAALDDATEEVDGYVGKRYRVPLADPPRIVKGWTAALARLKLAEKTGRVNDAVEKAADRAYLSLKELVRNQLDLPGMVACDDPDISKAGDPVTSGDRASALFGGGMLDAFTAPFTLGQCGAAWRNGG